MNTTLVTKKQQLLLDRMQEHADAEKLASAQQVLSILRLASAIDASCAEKLAHLHLSEGRFAVLLAVEAEPDTSPARLADTLDVTRATVTGLLDGLERQGHLRRSADPLDRRRTTLRLTPAGRKAIETLMPDYIGWLGQLMAGIPASELRTFVSVLSRISRNLGPETAGR